MKLLKLSVNAYGGISPKSPIIIDFTKSNHIVATGDNRTFKTTLLNSLRVAAGQLPISDDVVNRDSGKVDISLEFIGNDKNTYIAKVTKSTFKLTYEGESAALPAPMAKLKELLGVVGISPMAIKEKGVEDIIKWLVSYSNKNPEEFIKLMNKYKQGIKEAERSRADANRSLKGLNEYLASEPMFNDWEGTAKRFKVKPDLEKVSAELSEAGKNSDKYLRAEEKLKNLKAQRPSLEDDILDTETEIKELKEKLAKAELRLAEKQKILSDHDIAIATGEQFLKDNKSLKTDFDKVKERYDNISKDVVEYNKWLEIKKKKVERDEFENASIAFDTTAKTLKEEQTAAQAEILPNIKGVSLVMENYTDEGIEYKEGLYWNGNNARQMSETEWWTLIMKIWEKFKVRIAVIDNYQSLGSMGVEILQKLTEKGAYILAAEMNREQKTIEIEYE